MCHSVPAEPPEPLLKRVGFGEILLGALLFQACSVLVSSWVTLHLASLKNFYFLNQFTR